MPYDIFATANNGWSMMMMDRARIRYVVGCLADFHGVMIHQHRRSVNTSKKSSTLNRYCSF